MMTISAFTFYFLWITLQCTTDASLDKRKQNLMNVRSEFEKVDIDAYVIPSGDFHQSEYVADEDKRIKWISGFSGSAGLVVITKTAAALWTDGRYFLQAEQQLPEDWLLMKEGEPETASWTSWISLQDDVTSVGADPRLIGALTWLDWENDLKKSNISFLPVEQNLIDMFWNKTAKHKSEIQNHDLKYTGKTFKDKITDLREDLRENKAGAMIVTAMDEIIWLFNIRGNHIYNENVFIPVVKAYAIVTLKDIYLYVNSVFHVSCTENMNCITFKKYDQIWLDLKNSSYLENIEGSILLSKPWAYTGGASFAVFRLVPENKRLMDLSPIMMKKAQKNAVEIQGMENANMKDSVALIGFIAKLEKGMKNGEDWDEIKAAKELLKYRAKQNLFRGPSFTTISASGSNGAIIHYNPTKETNAKLTSDKLFLLDSGGQYLDGTTDVTRTFHFGTPTNFEKEAYTRVLMGAIDLAKAVFKPGTTDSRMDILTRSPLYSVGLDYKHGTGHGIGSYGLVHESPIQVRVYQKEEHELKVGMFFSDEPGVYIRDQFGIRLETVLRVVEKNLTYDDKGFGPFLGFETVCLMPFETKLIDFNLLNKEQIKWFNDYNQKIIEKIGPELEKQREVAGYRWMMERVQHIS